MIYSRKIQEHQEQIQIIQEKSRTRGSKYLNISQTITPNQKLKPDLDSSQFSLSLENFWEFFGVGRWRLSLSLFIRVFNDPLMTFIYHYIRAGL
jgi:hypothetical protein